MNYAHPKMNYIYVGVDCHKFIHVATVKNCFNENLCTITINNDTKGFETLVKKVNEHKGNLMPVYGLEDTEHLGYELANYLISHNYLVKHVNSNSTANERKKHPIISKNDELDSDCIAKVLLDELDSLPTIQNEEIYWSLKMIVNMRTSIVKNNTQLKNKLHAHLMHQYPNYELIFSNPYCKTALQFWLKYPNPQDLLQENFDSLISNLKKWSRGNLGLKKATQIITIVKGYELINCEYQEEKNIVMKMLIDQIVNNNTRLEEIEKEMVKLYDKTNCKLHTYPGISKVSGACMLSEIRNINRFKNSSALAKYAGIAPIEKSSGGKDTAYKNNYGNRQLNSMFYYLACRSISASRNGITLTNPIFKEYYIKKLKEGKTKHQAIICIMRRTCNILYNILKKGKEYEPPLQLIEDCNNSFRERKKEEEEKEKEKQLKKEKHKKQNT